MIKKLKRLWYKYIFLPRLLKRYNNDVFTFEAKCKCGKTIHKMDRMTLSHESGSCVEGVCKKCGRPVYISTATDINRFITLVVKNSKTVIDDNRE